MRHAPKKSLLSILLVPLTFFALSCVALAQDNPCAPVEGKQ